MTSEQDNEIDLRIEQNCAAVTILDEILNKYENEMLDSQSLLGIAYMSILAFVILQIRAIHYMNNI